LSSDFVETKPVVERASAGDRSFFEFVAVLNFLLTRVSDREQYQPLAHCHKDISVLEISLERDLKEQRLAGVRMSKTGL
jgi:hypothetical protein